MDSLPTDLSWSYGVTTVPSRRDTLLPATLQSLARTGFPHARLFVDGVTEQNPWHPVEGHLQTLREGPPVRTAGHWVLSLSELYYRSPASDYYALFQDDLLCCRNLREYLMRCDKPEKSYLNLFTFRENERLVRGRCRGWHEAHVLTSQGNVNNQQAGRGAVALVFDRAGVITLLSDRHLLDRAVHPTKGHQSVDGAVVEVMNKAGYREYVHNPSLVQHTGLKSTIPGHDRQRQAYTWPGEGYDPLVLLPAPSEQNQPSLESMANVANTPGLGDVIHRALSSVGVTEERVKKLLGKDCNCAGRRERLNALSVWARRLVAGRVANAREQLRRIIGE